MAKKANLTMSEWLAKYEAARSAGQDFGEFAESLGCSYGAAQVRRGTIEKKLAARSAAKIAEIKAANEKLPKGKQVDVPELFVKLPKLARKNAVEDLDELDATIARFASLD